MAEISTIPDPGEGPFAYNALRRVGCLRQVPIWQQWFGSISIVLIAFALRLDVGQTVVAQMHHPAAPREGDGPARESSVIDIAPKVRVDALQARPVDSDLARLRVHFELRHMADTTCA